MPSEQHAADIALVRVRPGPEAPVTTGMRVSASTSPRTGGIPTRPVRPLGYAGDCTRCPATGAAVDASAPSESAVVFAVGGTGASAA